MRIAIGIPTAGRAEILSATLSYVAKQTRLPDKVIICPARPEDSPVLPLGGIGCPIEITHGRAGLTSQRNRIIDAARDIDVLMFLDDDFLLASDCLAAVETLFTLHGKVVMATGMVLADGIHGPGLTEAMAAQYLREATPAGSGLKPVHNGYGCNMAFRMAPIRMHCLYFDEALPLYGWLEDLDFSRRLAPYGQIVRAASMRGVHLGVKRGRNSGVKFGYSQIANPIYLARRRSLHPVRAVRQVTRNVVMNLIRTPRPEAWIDRRGRLRGNALALRDAIRGRLSPNRILDLD